METSSVEFGEQTVILEGKTQSEIVIELLIAIWGAIDEQTQILYEIQKGHGEKGHSPGVNPEHSFKVVKCNDCGRDLPETKFHPTDLKRKNGIHRCKECVQKRMQETNGKIHKTILALMENAREIREDGYIRRVSRWDAKRIGAAMGVQTTTASKYLRDMEKTGLVTRKKIKGIYFYTPSKPSFDHSGVIDADQKLSEMVFDALPTKTEAEKMATEELTLTRGTIEGIKHETGLSPDQIRKVLKRIEEDGYCKPLSVKKPTKWGGMAHKMYYRVD